MTFEENITMYCPPSYLQLRYCRGDPQIQLLVPKAVVFHQWLYLMAARSEERSDEQSMLKSNVLAQIDFFDVYVCMATHYYEDFGISPLCLRMECFLANPNFDRHLPSISRMLGTCARKGIPIPSKSYIGFVDKVATNVVGIAPHGVSKGLEATVAVVRVIVLRLMDCTQSEISNFLFCMISHSMLGHFVVTSPVIALSILNREDCDAALLLTK
ncbi:hypothetical protein DFS33DRAFT_930162 [Desarmillaria ectypa]|nr:hypothetical protein DFS33DRAFT_930162 [Desarmillaria ectypa]